MATEQTMRTTDAGGTAGGNGTARRRGRKRAQTPKWVYAVAAIAICAVVGWVWVRLHPAQDITANMITGKVTRGNLVETVSATGSVEPETGAEVDIGSQITGVIKRLYADVGSKVTKGQIIAELDLPDLKDQYDESIAAYQSAQTKLQQTITGVSMTDTQIQMALAEAKAGVVSAQAKLADSQATANQQVVQTPTDIRKAQTALDSANAALATAKATLVQTQDGANLNVATAKEQLTQAQANEADSDVTLKRDQSLLAQGYVAQGVVDQAQATETVDASLISAAQENLTLTQQKVTADLETARDGVAEAVQTVASSKAALAAAKSEVYTSQARLADVVDSRAAEVQAEQSVQTALGNLAQVEQEQQTVEQAREAVAEAKATADYNEVQVQKSYIRTPISGTVLQLAEQQGETIAAGLSAPTLIVVADLKRLEIDTYVDETDIGSIKLGQQAQVVVDAYPKHTFNGTVTKIISGSTIQNGVVTYDVIISIKEDRRHSLKPDMTATATIQTGTINNVLIVPSVAVQLGMHGATVGTLQSVDGKLQLAQTRVQTGGSDGVNTEIRSGLTEGETIVVAGGQQGRGFGPANPFGPQQKPASSGSSGGGRGGG
jgi:HlyD family secretion protein